jgi:ADP-heptose:LPS heptosyltransferase
MKILVIRNDKLGDFMLAWPAISLLKKQYPDSEISVLVPAYTRPVAELCQWIDREIIDDGGNAVELARVIKAARYDVSISLFSEFRTAAALWLAGVPERFGPATKIAQVFLNHRLRQKRSLSQKPEYEYNVDLSRYFIRHNKDVPPELDPPPYLAFNPADVDTAKQQYTADHDVPTGTSLVFIHPGSGGSAINLSLEQFAKLARNLSRTIDAHFVITAGPDELDSATSLAALMHDLDSSVYHSTSGLARFARFISISDLFISGSTGPLHIAGALNVPTAAFYPARRSATPLRWQTLNEPGRRISFSPEIYTKTSTTLDLDIESCAGQISRFFLDMNNNDRPL